MASSCYRQKMPIYMNKFSKHGCSPPQNWAAPTLMGWLFLFPFPEVFIQRQHQVFSEVQVSTGMFCWASKDESNELSPCPAPECCWLPFLPSKPLDHAASSSCKPQTTELPLHLLASHISCHIALQYKPVQRSLRAPLTCAFPGLERQTASVKAVSIL